MDDMRTLAATKGVRIFEGTAAKSIEETKAGVVVYTVGGRVLAGRAVICSNGFTNSFGVDSLSHSLPIHIHALATRKLSPEVAANIAPFTAPQRMSRLDPKATRSTGSACFPRVICCSAAASSPFLLRISASSPR